MRDELLAPKAITAIERKTSQIINDSRHRATDDARQRSARRATLHAEIKQLVDAIATIGTSVAITERRRRAEGELATLDQTTRPNNDAPDRSLIARKVRETLLDPSSALKEDVHRDRAREALRQVLGEIRIEQEGDSVYANVTARLDRVVLAVAGPSLVRVAGTGFEPVNASAVGLRVPRPMGPAPGTP